MNSKTKLVLSIAVISVFFVATGALAVLYREPADPQSEPDQELSTHAAPLSQVVAYYEEQLDPEVPRIKVTARQFGDGCAVDYTLPYDGILRESDEKTQSDQEQTWFLNLMNNFWPLPILYDGYYELENWTEIPSHLSIQFEQPPEGEIVIKDYGIFDKYGVAVEADGFGNEWVGYIHTFEAAQELEFDLWLYDGIHLMSTQPELRGLRIECEIDGKQVEYYILFRSNYLGNIPFYGEDLSHLTPLQ